ncbi:MAG: MARVEL domain-containing protein [Candidatus Paceibacterota bacterium]|jgi:hypothetical protein
MSKDLTKENSATGKNKFKTRNKILVLGFILFVLLGIFSPVAKISALDEEVDPRPTEEVQGPPAPAPDPNKSFFENEIVGRGCMSLTNLNPFSDGCLKKVFYYIFHGIPAFLLWVSAIFFNVLLSVSLSSDLLKSPFVGGAWGVVRDLSNIFFILILLYISFKVILGMGGSEVKKMIGSVVIMALLINFSMFFTQVIIDSSNILALIFYNKIDVTTKNSDGTPRPYSPIGKDKDISGGLVNSFDPTKMLGKEFFDQATKQFNPDGTPQNTSLSEVPLSIVLSVILLAGAVMCVAAYVFFASGFFFLGRLIELLVLIIFSPFAFMTYTVPGLSGISDIGWKAWLDRLIRSALMAPIFMFFLYFIFMLISNKTLFESIIPKSTNNEGIGGMIKIILGVVLPCVLICVLLLKAKNYAKKGAGEIGEMVMKGAKIAGGLAIGGAALGTALAGRTLIARGAAAASRTEGAKDYGKARMQHNKDLEEWERNRKAGITVGAKPTWEQSKQAYQVKTGKQINEIHAIGGRINAAQSRSGEIDQARSVIDATKKSAGLEGVGDKFLSGVEKEKIEKTFTKDKRSEIETDIKRGHNAKNEDVIIKNDINGNSINAKGESDYKAKRRQEVIDETKRTDPRSIDATGELNDQGKKQVEDKLNKEFNEVLKNLTVTIGHERFGNLQKQSQQKVGIATRVASRTTSGTYDIRNLSTLKTDKREGIGAKTAIGLIAAVATGMRVGMKKGAGVEVGSPQGNILKDLGQTISESLKHAKIDIDLGGGKGTTHGPSASAHAPDHH